MIIKRINIQLDSKVSKLNGIKILHISDMHLSGRNRKVERYIDELAKIKVDLILITGDMVDDEKGIDWCVKYLSVLSAKHGIWAILGNHDKYHLNILHALNIPVKAKKNNVELLMKRLSENNIHFLVNKKKKIKINSVPVTLIGTDVPLYFDRGNAASKFSKEVREIKKLFSNIKDKEYVIVLNHVPHLLKLLGKVKIDLALCGHTHGGQIRLPFIGPLVAFSSFQRKYNWGFYNYNGYKLNISSGLGTSKMTPIRFLCPSDATILTLRR